jgi:peptidoglycan hydrolase CwlO-like protein
MDSQYTSLSRRTFLSGFAATAAAGVAACAMPHTAHAVTAAEKQAEADATYASLVDMQQQLDVASNNYTQALFELEDAQARMKECQAQIDEKTSEIAGLQDQLATRARAMYRSGGNHFLEVLVGSSTFEEFASNMDLLDDMNEDDAALVATTKQARADLETAKEEYAEQERLAQEKTDEAAQIEAEAQATVAEMQSVYDNLSAEAAELLEQERKAAEEEAARRAAAVVAASAAGGGEYQQSAEGQAHAESEAATDDGDDGGDTGDGGDDAASGGDSAASDGDPADDGGSSNDTSGGGTYEGGSDTVSRAYACLGAPYSWGAVGPDSYDCSGLVSYCLTGNHTRLGTTGTFMGWSQVSDPQPGDICTSSYHCGVYIGDGQMIHAADYGIGVIIGPVQSDMIIVRW